MTAVVADEVAARLGYVRRRIADCGGSVEDVAIVAVTKGFGAEAVDAALAAGLTDIGESYAQELQAKIAALGSRAARCRFHFLGRIQRNKVRHIAADVHLWHAVDRVAAGAEVARRRPGASVLVEVNGSGEPAKHGCEFDEAPALVDGLVSMGLDVRGLMAVGPTGAPDRARPVFRRVAALADRLGLPERSMGMTDDLEVAVEEGATIIRVGRALFGPRPTPPDLRR